MHILPTSFSKSVLIASVFCDYHVKPSFRYILVHVLPTSSSKRAPNLTVFFEHFEEKIELSLQIEADWGRTRGNRDPPSATTEATLPEKAHGFGSKSVFTREFARFRTVTRPNYLMMGGWHGDVVDMVVDMLTMTIVRNSEVFQLNFLWWYGMTWYTSSTAQGGGGSFKNRKPIGEVGCCGSGMAERSHWWTEGWLRSPLFLSLSLTIYLPTYLSSYLSIYVFIYLSIYLSLSLI